MPPIAFLAFLTFWFCLAPLSAAGLMLESASEPANACSAALAHEAISEGKINASNHPALRDLIPVLSKAEGDHKERAFSILKNTFSEVYGARNQILSDFLFQEDVLDQPFRGTLAALVGAQRFLTPPIWWQSPHTRDGFRIWAEDSKSPLKELLGGDSYRRIFWPVRRGRVDLGRVRIAVNYAKTGRRFIERNDWLTPDYSIVPGYEPFSLEMFARLEERWEPFYFIRVDHTPPRGNYEIRTLRDAAGGPPSMSQTVPSAWLPVTTFQGHPLATACRRCHGFPLSPEPLLYRSQEDYRAAGFVEGFMIDRLLEKNY